jgi:hypothetical protein
MIYSSVVLCGSSVFLSVTKEELAQSDTEDPQSDTEIIIQIIP